MASSKPTLALAATAHGEQTGWRKGQDLIDSLPYVDALTPEEKQAVEALIEEEMRRGSKRPADYLKELPPVPAPSFAGDEILENELSRVEAGEKMAGMDTKRYNLDPPPAAKRNDYAAWRQALDNAHSQLEHQYNRLINLELLLKFGPDAWRVHNDALAVCVRQLQEQLVGVRRQIEALNRERKLQQTAAGRELGQLEEEYMSLVHKNLDIEAACRQVEREIAQAQAALGLHQGEAGGDQAQREQQEGVAGGSREGAGQDAQQMEEGGQAVGGDQAEGAGGGEPEGRAGAALEEQQKPAGGGSGEEQAADGPMPAAEADAMQE